VLRSLRGRLTLGVLLVLAALLLAAGALVSRSVDAAELAAVDDRLERTAALSRATAVAAIQEELPEDDRRLDAVLSASRSSLRLLLGGSVLFEAGAPWPRDATLRGGLQTVAVGPERYRASTTSLEDPNLGGLVRLEVITSLAELERRQAGLRRRLAALGLLTLVVAGAGVWLAADLVLRPLGRLRAVTASIVGDEDLDRRVPAGEGPSELRALAASFNAMLMRLGRTTAERERALAATRRFAADAGHELRTPLTSAQATLSTLARHPDLPAERRAAMASEVLAEHGRLVGLLDGLQALARGEAGPLEHGAVDLAEVADDAMAATAARHPEVALTGELPPEPVVVHGWEPGLRVLVENLVANAALHGRPAGRVVVTLRCADGGPLLLVDDDGPGVPAAERARIFEPFARLDGAGRPGSGLGLALVAQQARHHGAVVEVGESPLGGARFAVLFPPQSSSATRGARRANTT